MNNPRFIVYVTPSIEQCLKGTYAPPKEDADLLRTLYEAKCSPIIDSYEQPRIADVMSCCGFLLQDSEEFTLIQSIDQNRPIKALAWFPEKLDVDDLRAAMMWWQKRVFKNSSGLDISDSAYVRLQDAGCLCGTEEQVSLVSYEAQGSWEEANRRYDAFYSQ